MDAYTYHQLHQLPIGTSLVKKTVVKNLPSNAGDAGSISGPGTKIPQAAEQLSPRATATEPQLENPWATLHDPRRSHVPQVRPDTDEVINYKQEGRGEV